MTDREQERRDVLAYLERKIGNADTMARRSAEFGEHASACRRQLEIVRDEIAAGMHLGEVEVAGGRPMGDAAEVEGAPI